MRVFVAINPPEAVKQRLYMSVRELREDDYPIRWVSPEAIHLTLKFLGELSESRLDGVAEALRRALEGVGRFEARAAGFGAFPSARRPSVVWVGVEGGARLDAAHGCVEEALAGLGFEKETRDFRPHMTLGRARRGARPQRFRGLEEALARLVADEAFPVGSVDVMRSTLKPTGAEYAAVRRIELERGGREDA